MKELSRNEYISEILYSYENSRWEFSFYPVLYLFLCQFRSKDIKLVYCADWKSRGKNTSHSMNENLKHCSTKFYYSDGNEHIGGIPDFQFVPSEYSYETPCKAKVFVEFKSPSFSNGNNYEHLEFENTLELEHEFINCDKIILTDGVCWYFLEKHKKNPVLTINIYDEEESWGQLKIKITEFISG